jgi:hypothetical protein
MVLNGNGRLRLGDVAGRSDPFLWLPPLAQRAFWAAAILLRGAADTLQSGYLRSSRRTKQVSDSKLAKYLYFTH